LLTACAAACFPILGQYHPTNAEHDHVAITSSNEFANLLVPDAGGEYRRATGDEVLKPARQVLGRRVRRGTAVWSPQVVRDFLRTKLADLEHEVFVALLQDAQIRLIEYVEILRGSPGADHRLPP
jgi:DNA repair protein RadC